MASAKTTFSLGERVYLTGQSRRLAIVIDWPADAAGDLLKMKNTHVAVRLERHTGSGVEQKQFWPRANIRREGEPEQVEPKVRPFYNQD